MNSWGTLTWEITRASGLLAFILLTLTIALGLTLSLRWQSAQHWPRLINNELHQFLMILSLIFIIIHVLTVGIDPFIHLNWVEVVIPGISHYRPLWVALGIVATYLGIAIGLSTVLRPRLGYARWRGIHSSTVATFGLALVHGIGTGSDTRTGWGMAIYASSILLLGTLVAIRMFRPVNTTRFHPGWALFLVAAVSFGVVWILRGIWQPGGV